MNAAIKAPEGREQRTSADNADPLSEHDILNLIAIWEAIAKLDPDPQERLTAEIRIEQLKAMRRH